MYLVQDRTPYDTPQPTQAYKDKASALAHARWWLDATDVTHVAIVPPCAIVNTAFCARGGERLEITNPTQAKDLWRRCEASLTGILTRTYSMLPQD